MYINGKKKFIVILKSQLFEKNIITNETYINVLK